jgi:hypothetical protein
MKCVKLTGTLEVSLFFFTLSSLHRSHLLLLLRPFVFHSCCCNACYQFTPPSNLRPVIFGSKPLAGLFPFIGLVYYVIFFIGAILIYANFSGMQLRHKTRPWSYVIAVFSGL